MKKFIALFLCAILLVSFASCKKGNESSDDDKKTETTTNEPEDSKNVQNYDELEYKSDDRFTNEELLTFKTGGTDFAAEKGYTITILEDSFGVSFKFGEKDAKPYSAVTTPFGVTVGNSLDTLIEKHSLDTGFAAYVKKGGAYVMYDAEKEIDISDGEGGCMYFGYALDGNGKWAFMDYYMLTQVIDGKLIVAGNEGDYDVVVYSCIVDDAKNITKITQLYGEVNAVMATIGNK
ncbi:MAG: hypothetical protein IJF69_01245 [Clostridia bacterium]|nr:hypothetical protein [Clostridia bacterium]